MWLEQTDQFGCGGQRLSVQHTCDGLLNHWLHQRHELGQWLANTFRLVIGTGLQPLDHLLGLARAWAHAQSRKLNQSRIGLLDSLFFDSAVWVRRERVEWSRLSWPMRSACRRALW